MTKETDFDISVSVGIGKTLFEKQLKTQWCKKQWDA